MSLFGLAEKKRIAVLENQVAAQQQLLDQMLKLTERSMDAYAKAHKIANEALAIVKGLSEKYSDDYEEDYDPKYKTSELDDLRNLVFPVDDDE